MLNASQRSVNKNSLTWWYVLKTSSRYLCKRSWRFLEDFFKTSWRHLEDVLNTFFNTSWRRFEEALKLSWQDILKTSRRRFCKTSQWRLENFLKMCWRGIAKTNILVLTKTPWRRLLKTKTKGEHIRLDQDVFWRQRRKRSSRRLHQDECLLKTSQKEWRLQFSWKQF